MSNKIIEAINEELTAAEKNVAAIEAQLKAAKSARSNLKRMLASVTPAATIAAPASEEV